VLKSSGETCISRVHEEPFCGADVRKLHGFKVKVTVRPLRTGLFDIDRFICLILNHMEDALFDSRAQVASQA